MAIASLFFAASSCSDDLDEDNGLQTSQQDEGDKAYMTVTITSPSSETRGEGDAENPYVYGTEAEHAIVRADFYFFNKAGKFITNSHVFNQSKVDGNHTSANGATDDGTATTENIEFNAVTCVQVKNYETDENTRPYFMVTVLNQDGSLPEPTTYDDLQKALTKATRLGGSNELNPDSTSNVYKTANGFIMSTSSRYDADKAAAVGSNYRYNVTYLTAANFFNSAAAAEAAAKNEGGSVKVYVERLAVKAQVDVDDAVKTDALANGAYKISSDPFALYSLDDNGDIKVDSIDLYAQFTGWGINCQPTRSYYMKHIDYNTWGSDDSYLGFTWNDPSNKRSYWGQSYNYGAHSSTSATTVDGYQYTYLTKYLTEYAGYTRAASEASSSDDMHLVYLPATKLGIPNSEDKTLPTTAIGDATYCPENTNSATVLQQVTNFQGAVSCALVGAILMDKDGNKLDVVKFNDEFFTREAYKQFVLERMSILAYTSNGAQMTYKDLQLSDSEDRNGQVIVSVVANGTVWYKNQDGTNAYTTTELDNALRSFNDEAPAVGYNKGAMYYSIPIEHLRPEAPSKSDIYNGKAKIQEGHFGVVRNHIYKLTIDELANPGHGVFNPDEPIVPPAETETKYYIGVKVNILSWKTVNQSVSL
jgi:hypothetical protein